MHYKVFEYNSGTYDIRYCKDDCIERSDGESVISVDIETDAYQICNALNVALLRGR